MPLSGKNSKRVLYDMIKVTKVDQVYMRLDCDRSTLQEICDVFTFKVPGHEYMPTFRKKVWDGKIRLFKLTDKLLYIGLLPYLIKFCKKRQYGIDIATNVYSVNNVEKIGDFYGNLALSLQPRDYQIDAFKHAVGKKRCVLVSPTASGKSLIIYLLLRYFLQNELKVLIVVPTTHLVEQLYKDFIDYGFDSDNLVHRIYQGREIITHKNVVISTWQSLYKLKKEFFSNFGAIIGDEAHLFKAKSLTSIMTKLVNAEYRIGTTGTLDGTETNQMVLEGLFGLAHVVTTTQKLIDTEVLANLNIRCIVLRHDMESSENVSRMDYRGEIDFLVSSTERNEFIVDMVSALKGNILVLYQLVEKHGEILHDLIRSSLLGRKVVLVHGKIDTDVREVIRETAEKVNNLVIVASYGTYSTGINIKNLHNIVFASPSKSRIRNLQSIGRGLRRGLNKKKVNLFDVADNLTIGDYKNYTYRHLEDRLKIYNDEKFKYDIKQFSLGYEKDSVHR
jgi:superfamily II DNA or RNA helicase